MKLNLTILDSDYRNWIDSLNQRYRRCQLKAVVKVNSEMLQFYWLLGRDIVSLHAEERWGSNFMSCLSKDLKTISDTTSFSPTNLYYIKKFYLFYCQRDTNLPQAGVKSETIYSNEISQQSNENLPQFEVNVNDLPYGDIFSLPWGHHKLLIDKFYKNNDVNKAVFYMQMSLKEGWSRSVLLNFIGTNLYERQGNAITNFALTLPNPQSDLANETMRDPYCFDFTKLRTSYNERLLKDELVKNIEKFLLELGTGFAYMGREYRLKVGDTEQFVDMLFYNVKLRCYVVIEVKTVEFESSHIGQLGAYVVAIDHLLRKDDDNKTIGLLICRSKDRILAQYALESSSQPLAVSDYELEKFYPREIEGIIPSVEDIERHLEHIAKSSSK